MKKAIAIVVLFSIIVAVAIANTCGRSIKCVAVKEGIYEDKYEFKGIYLFDEDVTYEGQVDETYLYADNGQKVSCNSEIAKGITCNKAGMMYLGLDGYEGCYTLNNVDEISLKDIDNVINVRELKGGIKIIDNSTWYIYMLLNKDIVDFVKKGSSIKLIIGEKYYPAVIDKLYDKDEGTFARVHIETDPDITDLRRGVTGYIIKSSYEGIIVPSSAISHSNEKDGVYINFNGYTAFRKVQVLYSGDEISVVTAESGKGKLSRYDSVVKKAEGIKSGMKIK